MILKEILPYPIHCTCTTCTLYRDSHVYPTCTENARFLVKFPCIHNHCLCNAFQETPLFSCNTNCSGSWSADKHNKYRNSYTDV